MSHLAVLQTRLANEKDRFAKDNSPLRKVWITQIEKEIAREVEFLESIPQEIAEMSDDELMAALTE
jgi:hypothetical protein